MLISILIIFLAVYSVKRFFLDAKGPVCQSCGMPLSKDKSGGGTNTDGTKSVEYCSYCFMNGTFIEPNITVQEIQNSVKTKLKTMKIPGFLVFLFTKNISKLKRWKSTIH